MNSWLEESHDERCLHQPVSVSASAPLHFEQPGVGGKNREAAKGEHVLTYHYAHRRMLPNPAALLLVYAFRRMNREVLMLAGECVLQNDKNGIAAG